MSFVTFNDFTYFIPAYWPPKHVVQVPEYWPSQLINMRCDQRTLILKRYDAMLDYTIKNSPMLPIINALYKWLEIKNDYNLKIIKRHGPICIIMHMFMRFIYENQSFILSLLVEHLDKDILLLFLGDKNFLGECYERYIYIKLINGCLVLEQKLSYYGLKVNTLTFEYNLHQYVPTRLDVCNLNRHNSNKWSYAPILIERELLKYTDKHVVSIIMVYVEIVNGIDIIDMTSEDLGLTKSMDQMLGLGSEMSDLRIAQWRTVPYHWEN
jgi:hypothetical protein